MFLYVKCVFVRIYVSEDSCIVLIGVIITRVSSGDSAHAMFGKYVHVPITFYLFLFTHTHPDHFFTQNLQNYKILK